ncbi:MAG: DUF4011 domain-containing protein, partial [Deltaproteobacteria bacterium]|nr:DUF4011 domain-containing protein [Deltaproteobacteria bacterium]
MLEPIELLRNRLLDLSRKNSFLNYRHPKGRSIQFVNNPDLNRLFEHLVSNNKAAALSYVKEPIPHEYESGKKPEARQYANTLGLDISYEFSTSRLGTGNKEKRIAPLQTLFYPADLEKRLRKMLGEARTVIEETGTNMLFLMFGFLEFYESDDSEQKILAPLVSVPVVLTKGEVDPSSTTYRYTLSHSGEDVAENQTLREKLKQDFRLNLPELEQEETPESLFCRIEDMIRAKHRWQVRRQLTLGFLSFGKLAIWADLDAGRWPDRLSNPILKNILEGGDPAPEAAFHAEEYDIDRHPLGNLKFIYDVDSSQHSAIIDVLNGKNIVIVGPPGTGKSQTITNIIALSLERGKTVLFVSGKLAALEVVQRRLENAGLGHFCLELHSHKTQEKKLIEDLKARVTRQFVKPIVNDEYNLLNKLKNTLNGYVTLVQSRTGNNLGKSVYDVFGKAVRCYADLGSLVKVISKISLPDAPNWTNEHFENQRANLVALSHRFTEIEMFDDRHPWWGFSPQHLLPGEDNEVAEIINEATDTAGRLVAQVDNLKQVMDDNEVPSLPRLHQLSNGLNQLNDPPAYLIGELLPLLFPESDPAGRHTAE